MIAPNGLALSDRLIASSHYLEGMPSRCGTFYDVIFECDACKTEKSPTKYPKKSKNVRFSIFDALCSELTFSSRLHVAFYSSLFSTFLSLSLSSFSVSVFIQVHLRRHFPAYTTNINDERFCSRSRPSLIAHSRCNICGVIF